MILHLLHQISLVKTSLLTAEKFDLTVSYYNNLRVQQLADFQDNAASSESIRIHQRTFQVQHRPTVDQHNEFLMSTGLTPDFCTFDFDGRFLITLFDCDIYTCTPTLLRFMYTSTIAQLFH